jgi:signal transduction histidine kinase
MSKLLRRTAAWRIAISTTLAFAMGTASVFLILYFVVARGIWSRSDAWLSGEVQVLAQVSADTPPDHLHDKVIGDLAELVTREMPDERNDRGQKLNSVFFLEEDSNNAERPLWVGPSSEEAFVRAIQLAKLAPGSPQPLQVEGGTFRVVTRQENGQTIYLGLSARGVTHLLHTLSRRFLLLWGGIVFIGFLTSFESAYRTLRRVERITETVGQLDSKDLAERLPEPVNRDEIARLAKTFNRMLDRIQTSVTELRLVTDSVAHDLKGPLTTIRGTLESVVSGEANQQWRDFVCEAIEGIDRLLNVLNTTLDVAEGQAGALRLDRNTVDFSSVVSQVVDLYQPALAEQHHDLTLDVEGNVVVDADLSLLHRVLSNLLENELTHLPTGCRITIRLRQCNGSADLVIEDTGPGFPLEIRRRAFERFVKGKNSPGHGLGLAFVDAVLRAHGGSASISNGPVGGAVVTLSLPAKAVESASLTVAG